MLAVETKNLGKHYMIYNSFMDRIVKKGIKLEALRGVDLKIKKGEIFGLLGPNGAGKTTLVNILSTLLLPDSGKAEIFGLDVASDAEDVRKIITLCSAYTGFFHQQTVKENLGILARIYNKDLKKIDSVISLSKLDKYKDTRFDELSSGNKQKLSIAKFLLSNPKVLLLDELTIGLDPEIAAYVRNLIKSWSRKHKTTIVMTTHNMYEADELCNRVAIIHKGMIVACDTPSNLKKIMKEEECIEISLNNLKNPSKILSKIEGIGNISFKSGLLLIHVDDAEKRLQRIIKTLISNDYHVKTIKVREPTLEDVFLKLVGVRLE